MAKKFDKEQNEPLSKEELANGIVTKIFEHLAKGNQSAGISENGIIAAMKNNGIRNTKKALEEVTSQILNLITDRILLHTQKINKRKAMLIPDGSISNLIFKNENKEFQIWLKYE